MTLAPRIVAALRHIAFGVVVIAFVYVIDQLGLLEWPWWLVILVGAVLVSVLRECYFLGKELEEEEEEETAAKPS